MLLKSFYHDLKSDGIRIKKNTEAVAPRISVKKAFLKISRNSQENTCDKVTFFIKLQTWGRGLEPYEKRDSGTSVFLWILRIF